MNSIFGDATTAAPTPATLREAESLFSDSRSPIPPMRLGDDSDHVPDMDLQPPEVEVEDGRPVFGRDREAKGEGAGGWISNIANRGAQSGGRYSRVDQGEDDQ